MSEKALSPKELDLMTHALGWPEDYRNYFAASPGTPDDEAWRSLVERGVAKQGRSINEPPDKLHYFYVSKEGRALVEAYRPKPKRARKRTRP